MEKSAIYNLIIDYQLFDSERDLDAVYDAMNVDDFADFAGYLFTGDWSRNIYVLDADTRRDERVKELYEHIENHCG